MVPVRASASVVGPGGCVSKARSDAGGANINGSPFGEIASKQNSARPIAPAPRNAARIYEEFENLSGGRRTEEFLKNR